MVEAPGPPSVTKALEMVLFTCGEPAATVDDCSICAVSLSPRAWARSLVSTWTGEALVNSFLGMREPVTTISSTSVVCSSCGAADDGGVV